MRVLVPNLGSTSLKYQLIETPNEKVMARGRIDRIGAAQSEIVRWQVGGGEELRTFAHVPDYRVAVNILLDSLPSVAGGDREMENISAVGFKAVHGGPRFCGSFLVNDDLLGAMRDYTSAAPVHNAVYIQAMELFREALPGVPMVAVFETGFHDTIPEYARVYGVPAEWRDKYGIRRFGFHGSSHRYVSRRVPELMCRQVQGLRLVSCHLGGSSSIAAIFSGRSIDTSMGFSPQTGLEQSSRCGDLDVFAVLHVMDRENLRPADVRELLCTRGGLLAISGVSKDFRDLEHAAREGNARAQFALQTFAYQVKKHIGAYAAALGGLDAVAFTGGIGENSPEIRQQVCEGLEYLGLHLNRAANRTVAGSDLVISLPCSRVAVAVISTNEELMVARETATVVGPST